MILLTLLVIVMMFDDDSDNSEDGNDGGDAEGDRHSIDVMSRYCLLPNISSSMLHDLNAIYFIFPTLFIAALQNLRVLIAFSWSHG